ncbi:MAG: response regulator [Bauldia sp.]
MGQSRAPDGVLAGARVLIVEDDAIIVLDLEAVFMDAGAVVIGPCRTVKAALTTLESERCDAAILDLRLGRDDAGPIARMLDRQGTPFLFYTGQSASDPLLKEWEGHAVVGKPAQSRILVAAVADLLRPPAVRS